MSAPRGFSLLEAVVALVVLGLAGAAALGAVAAELRAAERGQRGLEAASLALDRLARIRLLSRDQLSPLADSLRRGRFAAPFGEYRWESSARSRSGEKELFDVHVAVHWESGSYALDTRLYRPLPLASAQ